MNSLFVVLLLVVAVVSVSALLYWWLGPSLFEEEPLVPVALEPLDTEEETPAPLKPVSTAPAGRTIIKTGRTEFFLGGDRDPSDFSRMM